MRNTDSDHEGVEVPATLHQQLSTCTPLPLHPPNAQLRCKLLLGLKTFVVYYIERSLMMVMITSASYCRWLVGEEEQEKQRELKSEPTAGHGKSKTEN
jgi:hypothetical protein